jgi:hypothetical protein
MPAKTDDAADPQVDAKNTDNKLGGSGGHPGRQDVDDEAAGTLTTNAEDVQNADDRLR